MSRVVSSNMLNAINKLSGIRSEARITIYDNRNYFSEFTGTSGSPTYSQPPAITDTPIPQCSEFDTTNSRLYTLLVNPSDSGIEIVTTGSPQICKIFSSGSQIKSPKWAKPTTKFPYLYHVDLSGNLKVETLNMTILRDSFTSGSLNCVTAGSIIESITSGSITALCAIGNLEFVRLFIDDGGIGVIHYSHPSTTWVKNTYPHRFMIPDQILTSGSDSGYLLNYFTAVKRDDGVWIYLSYPSGEVKGLHINTDGIWSDIFTSIPKDLSVFKIGNAYVDTEQRIHLIGQFQRIDDTGDFSSDSIWNLSCWSDDGKTFSLDRNTLFSLMGYRFSAILAGNYIYYVDSNRYVYMKADYNSIYENADNLVLTKEITSLDGTPESGYSVSLLSPDDQLLDDPLLSDGNIAIIEIGVNTSGSLLEYITWDTCSIVSLEIGLADSQRGLTLELLSESMYRLSQFSYPFYLEMQGKQSVYDPLDDMGNMYQAPLSSGIKEAFSCDMWGNEDLYSGGGLPWQFHNTSGSQIMMSKDLKDLLYLTDYPIINTLPLTFKIYGWSRIGLPDDAYEYSDDTTPYTNPNDDFVAIIKVQHEDETEETIQLTAASAVDGISYPPQTWKEGNSRITSGSNPVEYLIGVGNGLVEGDKVLEVGVLIASSSCTVFYIERIEIPELDMYLDPSAMPQDSHEIVEITDYTPAVESSSLNYPFTNSYNGWSYTPDTTHGTVTLTSSGITLTGNLDANTISGYVSKAFSFPVAAGTYIDFVVTARKHGDPHYNPGGWSAVITYSDSSTSTITRDCENWLAGGWSEWSALPDNTKVIDNYNFPIPAEKIGLTITNISIYLECYAYSCNYDIVLDNVFVESPGSETVNETLYHSASVSGIKMLNYGIPNVYFSSKPYSAFNFETSCKVSIIGEYAYGGLVGIAQDGRNFICGRYGNGSFQIVKVRDGEETILTSGSYISSETYLRMMFIHNNGDFYIRVQENGIWGNPILTYRWKYIDGPIATDNDLFHVGIFSINDIPKFRICGFDPSSTSLVGLLPGYDPTALNDFPTSGSVIIDNVTYYYTGKTATTLYPKGPYQVRCANSWNYVHPNDGESYNGNSIEVTNFEWLNNPTNHEKYKNYIMIANAGYGWLISETDFKAWITSEGHLEYLKNRGRYFCDGLNPDIGVSCSDKAFITIGLTGVTIAEDQESTIHQEGSYCYKSAEGSIQFTDFYASSDDQDATIADLIKKICRMAGAKSKFTGDTNYSTLSLVDGSPELL